MCFDVRVRRVRGTIFVRKKTVSIQYFDPVSVSVALIVKKTKRMCLIILSSVACPDV